jgi:hypothetical protein
MNVFIVVFPMLRTPTQRTHKRRECERRISLLCLAVDVVPRLRFRLVLVAIAPLLAAAVFAVVFDVVDILRLPQLPMPMYRRRRLSSTTTTMIY